MQKDVWEKEYKNPKLVTGYDKPQSFFLRFLKDFKKDFKKGKIYRDRVPERNKIDFEGLKVLDLGSGTGRNTNYLAQKGAEVVGMEISDTAIEVAKKRAEKLNVDVNYLNHNMGSKYPFKNEQFDLVIDITSSNSLNEKERKVYLSEVMRVLKLDGTFFVRALCKDGDKNVKYLLKNNSADEKDTYKMPKTGLVERVFLKDDFEETYSKYFKILKLEKTESYSTVEIGCIRENFG